MKGPELVLVGGPPWSGKTTVCEKVVELGRDLGYSHLSIGNLKRSIENGSTESEYRDELMAARDKKYGAKAVVSQRAILGIFGEFLLRNQDADVILVDGFPRYPDRVEPFKARVQDVGAYVSTLCVIDVPNDVIKRRALQYHRPGRPAPSRQEVEERIADHRITIEPTLNLLAQNYPTYRFDGENPSDQTAASIYKILQPQNYTS